MIEIAPALHRDSHFKHLRQALNFFNLITNHTLQIIVRSNIHGLNCLQERAADLAALFSLTFHSTDFMLTHPRHPLPIARPLIYTSAESAR